MSGYQSSWLDDHPDVNKDPSVDAALHEALRLAAGHTDYSVDPALLDTLEYSEKIAGVFEGDARYRCAFGGRGSGKSWQFAQKAVERGCKEKLRIFCGREIQRSIEQSVMSQIVTIINSKPFLKAFYEVGKSYIRGKNGTEFIFGGLRHNINEIKSMEGVDIAWIEEAEGVSEYSWKILTPTIRAEGSEIWITWNPESADSATHERFIRNPPNRCNIAKVNYMDNPWFTSALEEERTNDFENRDYEYYEHVWLGEVITISEAQIFAGCWDVADFEPKSNWDGPYQGLDFGFSNDPMCATRAWVFDNTLYIEYDNGGTKIELDDITPYLLDNIPFFDEYVTRADNSRPDSISYLERNGLPHIEACTKPRIHKGSIKDGIEHIKQFNNIVIHSRCDDMIKEARLYSYKVDRLTGDVLPVVVDAFNHRWDALRYSLEPMMENTFTNYEALR